jgi:pimeloyl-ACP methyl ester carboxylesterase
VVLFDRRGTGLSDRSPWGERVGLAALGLDIKAVLDACGTRRAVLFGVTFGCPVAIWFAASCPDRVQALVVAGGFARLAQVGEFDFEVDPAQVDDCLVALREGGSPGWSGTPALRERWRRCAGGRQGSMSARCWLACGCQRW